MSDQPAPEYLQGAVIGLDNQTGDILVLVGGRDFEHNQYDRALQAKRPAGTAMLPFVYAAAFEKGMFPGSLVEDSPLDNRAVMIGGTTGILGEWGPESGENRYEGAMTARQALAKSKNGATIRIGMNAGVDSVLQLSSAAGVRSSLRPYPATFLGSSEITIAELALAYTIFPNGGWRPGTPHILERIEEKDGSVVWDAKSARTRQTVIKSETAYQVHSCLVDALESGTGKAARAQFGLKKMPAAGKTGTAYDFTDALFAGYDSNFTCAVWMGFDKPQKIYRGAFGRELALPVWVDIMNAAAERYPPREITRPSDLKEVEICSRSGLLATDKCYDAVKGTSGDTVQRRTTYMEIATSAQMPTEPCNVHGEPRARLVRDLPSSDLPRAELAVDLSEVTSVVIKSPTLLADKDPYNSVKPTLRPEPEPEAVKGTTETAKIGNATAENSATPAKPEKIHEPESDFHDTIDPGAGEHPPINFHGYAACTRGAFHYDTRRAITEETPILLLLRGDFRNSERAIGELKKHGRKVAVSLKETGLHQIAQQLCDRAKLSRFITILAQADGCIATTPEAAEIYQRARWKHDPSTVAFIPTPYPLEDGQWNFSVPPDKHTGIFLGTREWDVPSRNHFAALLVVRQLCEATSEPVTVVNLDGYKARRLLWE